VTIFVFAFCLLDDFFQSVEAISKDTLGRLRIWGGDIVFESHQLLLQSSLALRRKHMSCHQWCTTNNSRYGFHWWQRHTRSWIGRTLNEMTLNSISQLIERALVSPSILEGWDLPIDRILALFNSLS
jgi:hypothetical protein